MASVPVTKVVGATENTATAARRQNLPRRWSALESESEIIVGLQQIWCKWDNHEPFNRNLQHLRIHGSRDGTGIAGGVLRRRKSWDGSPEEHVRRKHWLNPVQQRVAQWPKRRNEKDECFTSRSGTNTLAGPVLSVKCS